MFISEYITFSQEIDCLIEGKTLNLSNWDSLRTDDKDSPLAIERTVQKYEDNCLSRHDYETVAKCIVDILKRYGFINRKIISMGVDV